MSIEILSPNELANGVASGVLHRIPDVNIDKGLLADESESFTKALVTVTKGAMHTAKVTGPLGQEVEQYFGFLGGPCPKTAVFEVLPAAGWKMLPWSSFDPLTTTTYGVGELIKTILDAGVQKLLIGCGGSGINDGGAGMAQALGVRLLDAIGQQIPWGAEGLAKLVRIDMSNLDPRIHDVEFEVACNLNSVLCGPRGISKIFGPEQGASPQAMQLLTAAFENYADVIQRNLGIDVRTMPGSGAGGGLGTGLHVFLKATLS